MTSSTHDLTDNEGDGQQQSESQMQQPISANGISHAGIDTQIVQYAAPPQLGAGHAM
ncbi:nuclear transcription factor Y subunit A-7, partial [Trifolium pratense]